MTSSFEKSYENESGIEAAAQGAYYGTTTPFTSPPFIHTTLHRTGQIGAAANNKKSGCAWGNGIGFIMCVRAPSEL